MSFDYLIKTESIVMVVLDQFCQSEKKSCHFSNRITQQNRHHRQYRRDREKKKPNRNVEKKI